MFDWVLNTILKLISVFAKKKKQYMLDRSINRHLRTPAFWIVFFFLAKYILLPKEISKII